MFRYIVLWLISVISLGLTASPALAQVRLPHIFSDHMVLQAGQPVPVWGWASPGEHVSVRFGGQSKTTVANAAGRWQVSLGPLPRSSVPAKLTISGKSPLVIADVLVGEVWLASGQSNMEKPLGEQRGQKPTLNYVEELKRANLPEIRLFKVTRARSKTLGPDVIGAWVKCSPEALLQVFPGEVKFSATAYYFGKKLHQELNSPVGMIDSSSGGSRIEPWTPPSGFAAVPSLNEFAEAAKTPGTKVENTEISTLYNAMIAPLVPFAIKGVLWYQGESNIIDNDDGARYADKMTALIKGWRGEWNADFPVYYVQLAPHLYHVQRPNTVIYPDAEPRLWEAQTASLRLPNTGMIVTTDLVQDLFDIHPQDKKNVGERLARWALNKNYGRRDVVVSGPLFQAMTISGSQATLSFSYLGGGLVAKGGRPLNWFAVAGADNHFYPAEAVIDGDKVVVSSPKVAAPVTVHFAWDEGARPNFFNKAGLPAVPFRTDSPFGVVTPANP